MFAIRSLSAQAFLVAIAFLLMPLGRSSIAKASDEFQPQIMSHLYGGAVRDLIGTDAVSSQSPTTFNRTVIMQPLPEVQEVPMPAAFSMGGVTFVLMGSVAGYRKFRRRFA